MVRIRTRAHALGGRLGARRRAAALPNRASHRRRDARGVEPAVGEQLRRVAVVEEGVGQPELQQRDGDARGGQRLGRPRCRRRPCTTFSSTVTSASCSRASSATRPTSSGFTKRMLATVASSSSAAASAWRSTAAEREDAMRPVRRERGAPELALADRQRRHLRLDRHARTGRRAGSGPRPACRA